MKSDDHDNPVLDPSFFEGRYLVEIVNWDWELHVGMSPQAAPEEQRFQGGLLYTRGINIEGRIIAPNPHRGKHILVWVSPIGSDIKFGPGGLEEVGQFHEYKKKFKGRDFDTSLLLPADSLSNVLACLESVWKYIHIWTVDDPLDRASVTNFCFSRGIHKNLLAWSKRG